MFKTGDTVLYSATGVCTVSDIEKKVIGKEIKLYYVLKPISKANSTVYVPVDSEKLVSKMHDILSKEELLTVIHESKSRPDIWIDNDQTRREEFTKILSNGNRLELLLLVRSLCAHRDRQVAMGRKFHIADSKIFDEAERILYDELSWTFEIDTEDVPAFIEKELAK